MRSCSFPALRGPGDRLPDHPVLHHPCLEPQTQQLRKPAGPTPAQRPGQAASAGQTRRKSCECQPLRPTPGRVGTRPECSQGLQRRPAGTKAIRDLQEVGLENRLQHQPRGLLTDPVTDRRDPERPPTTIRLRDPHTPDRRRAIRPSQQRTASSPSIRSTPYSSTPANVNDQRQPHPYSPAPASTPPEGRHSSRSGHTERGNGVPGTAWHMPIAPVEVLAHPRPRPPTPFRWPGRRAKARRGDWTARGDHALTLTFSARVIKAGVLRSQRL